MIRYALANATFPDAAWDELNLASFTCPTGQRANASIAANNPTWRYRYHGVFPNTNISSEGGAWHGSELQLVFGTTFGDPASTTEENAIEAYIQKAWTTFAKDPVNGLAKYDGGWPTYDPAKETLIRLAFDSLTGRNLAFPGIYEAGCATANLTRLICSVSGTSC